MEYWTNGWCFPYMGSAEICIMTFILQNHQSVLKCYIAIVDKDRYTSVDFLGCTFCLLFIQTNKTLQFCSVFHTPKETMQNLPFFSHIIAVKKQILILLFMFLFLIFLLWGERTSPWNLICLFLCLTKWISHLLW